MNKIVPVFFLSFFLGAFLYAQGPAIAVLDFDSGNYCTAQKAAIMTDLFRNELIRSGRADIVDRRNMNRVIDEIKFQMSDWVNPVRIKQAGRMIGADYLMTGNFDMLGDTLYLVVQMLDIETSRAVYSSRMTLVTWEEYDRKVSGFAGEFTAKLPQPELFTGTWSADIPYNGGFDTYEISFLPDNRCSVRATSTVNGKTVSQDAQGSYSYDGTFFKLNALFRNVVIPHIQGLQWTSVTTFNANNSAFNILAAPADKADPVRVTFTKR
jgi:TolB-like protein